MLGFQPHFEQTKAAERAREARSGKDAPMLIGYILTTKSHDPGNEASSRLERKAEGAGCSMRFSEWDIGYTSNPYRVGLWRALRRLVCASCEPRRLPFSLVNFNDFVTQALKPCICGNTSGLDGIVVQKLDHITSDAQKGTMLVLELAIRGKHVIAEDGICLSCCHPATKQILGRS
jgi:hypothetical protein